uniref:IS3 family transposase n=1 Tax=Shewanella algae TaxID=38313 RepID=UPI0031F4C6C6
EGCAVKKVVTPAAKKPVVQHLIEGFSLSERVACQLAGLSRTAYRYQSRTKPDNGLRQRLKALATQYPRYGYLMLHGLLRGEGLQVRTKKRKKLTRPRQPMEVPTAPNQRWSMDFVSDQLSNGRRFWVLNVVDDYSREMVGQLVSVAISGRQVARFLDQLMEERGKPKKVTCDNGTEFTSKAMFFWSKEAGVTLGFIQPRKPTQNAFVESLNGKFRNECLNQHWFRTLDEARYEIELWREHYNYVRPHSSLNYMPPVSYAKQAA